MEFGRVEYSEIGVAIDVMDILLNVSALNGLSGSWAREEVVL